MGTKSLYNISNKGFQAEVKLRIRLYTPKQLNIMLLRYHMIIMDTTGC